MVDIDLKAHREVSRLGCWHSAGTTGPVVVLAEELARIDGIESAFLYGSFAARMLGDAGPAPHDIDVKDIVDVAAREYIDAHRDEINAGIKAALGQLNGTDSAAVSLMTGRCTEELDDLGGLPK